MFLDKKEAESQSDYIKRLVYGKLVDKIIDVPYEELGKIIFGEDSNYSTSEIRRRLNAIKFYIDAVEENNASGINDYNNYDIVKNDNLNGLQVKKDLVLIKDYKNEINANIRSVSRFENLKEISSEFCKQIDKIFPLDFNKTKSLKRALDNSNTYGILMLSDWHYGIEIDNFLNKYNPEIFKQRINILLNKVKSKIYEYDIETLYIVNLNDLISGIIHNIIRIQNRENLIQQIMVVAESLAEFINQICFAMPCRVKYFSTTDNHSRAIAKKDDNLDGENFSLLIDWYIKTRLSGYNTDAFEMCKSEVDAEICTFSIYDWKYCFVHGDKDKPSNVVQRLSGLTKKHFNVCGMAHYHHFMGEETNGCYVVSNGSLSGVDDLSKRLRLSSIPSQVLLVASEKDCLEDICILKLNS